MSKVQALFDRRVAKCPPGQPAYHPQHGWGTVVSANGLLREIEVVVRIESRNTFDSGVLQEEVLHLETFDVHVSELICPTAHAAGQNRKPADVLCIMKS